MYNKYEGENMKTKKVKALNIRNTRSKPKYTKSIGLFKALAYAQGLSQAKMLHELMGQYYENNKSMVKQLLKKKNRNMVLVEDGDF
jgi:hypothetical protein